MDENWTEIFEKHFFDARKNAPKKGQILAKYIAVAEFIEGRMKKDIIHLLQIDKATAAAQLLKRMGGAKEPDCYRVCAEMAEDLLLGSSEEEVEKKPYKYKLEQFFYTEKQYVPRDDPHWQTIELLWDHKDVLQKIEDAMEKSEETDI
jgi:hypothetical protein